MAQLGAQPRFDKRGYKEPEPAAQQLQAF